MIAAAHAAYPELAIRPLCAADGGVAIEDMPALLDSLIKRARGVAPVRCPA